MRKLNALVSMDCPVQPTALLRKCLPFLLLFLSSFAYGTNITSTGTGGSWSSTGSWVGGVVPGSGDNATIAAGATVTLGSSVSVASLTVAATGILDVQTNTITIGASGSAVINGTLKIANTNGFYGGSCAISNTNSPTITLGSSSTIEYNASGFQTITVYAYANLTISGNRGGNFLTIASGNLDISGTFNHSATNDNYNNTGSTIRYTGTNQVVAIFPYYDLNLSLATTPTLPSGTVILKGAFTPGSLTGTSQGTINFAGSGQTIPAFNYNNLDLTSGGSISFAAGTVGIAGTFTIGFTSSSTQGTIKFNGSNQTVPAFGYYNLDLTGATGTAFSTSGNPVIAISGSFTPGTITSATSGSSFNFKGSSQVVPAFNYYNLDLTNATSTTFANGVIGVSGTFNKGSITGATQGTFNFKGSTQTVPAFNFNNLDLTGATGTIFSTASPIGITGSFVPGTITSATQFSTFNFKGSSQTVPAFNYYNLDLTSATGTSFSSGTVGVAGTFTPASISSTTQGTFLFNGSNQTVPAFTYNNLDLTGSTNTSFSAGTVGIKNTFTPGSITSANQGTINYLGTNQTPAAFGYYALNLTGATGVTFPNGTVGVSSTFTPGTTTTATQGTINFKGSGQTVPAFNYNNLDLSNGNSVSFATSAPITIAGTFTKGFTSTATTGSTINFKGSNQTIPTFGYYNLDLTGATGTSFGTTNFPGIDIYGAFTPASITSATSGSNFNFKGSSGQTVPAFNYYNVDLNNTSHTFPTGTVGIAGTFNNVTNNTATQGTIDFNGSNQSVPSFTFNNLSLVGATGTTFTNSTVNINGSFSPGTVTSGGTNYTIQYSGSGQTVAAFNYYNLNLTGTGTTFANGTIGIGNSFAPGSITSANQGTISYTSTNAAIQSFTYYGLDLSVSGTMNTNSGVNLTVNGPFSTGSGTTFNLFGNTPTTYTINGDLIYNGNGTSSMQYLTLNLTGSGNMSGLGSGNMPNIIIASGATRNLTGNFNVVSGTTLTVNGTLDATSYKIVGSGSLLLSSAAKIKVGNSSGLSGAFAGTIAYTFSAGADYVFNGTGAQSTGFTGVTKGAPRSITISNSGGDVTLDQSTTLGNSGQFVVSSGGSFDAGTNILSFGTSGSVTIAGTFKTTNTNGFSGSTSTAISSTNSPIITIASGSTIGYTASSAQTISARSDYHHLLLSNGQKSLAGATTLAGNITLSNGSKLLLGTNNISIGGVMNGDASNYAVTNSTGSVTLKSVTNTGKQFLIGISTTSYSPFTVAQADGLDWTVNVQTGNVPTHPTSTDNIQRTWTITPSVNPTVSSATITFQYNEADAGIQGSTWSTSSYVTAARYNGTVWAGLGGNVIATGTAGGIRTATFTGVNQFSPWIVAKGGAILPVELISFSGKKERSDNLLQWTTGTENNNKGFEVQRSVDGVKFNVVSFVNSSAPAGNSSADIHYSYTDVNPAGSKLYYRLKQVDIDWRSKFSNTILITGDAEKQVTLSGIYPNPAQSELNAWIAAVTSGSVNVAVVDMFGRTVQSQALAVGAGSNAIRIDVSRLAAGSYVLKVLFGGSGEVATAKFVKD